MIKLLYWCAFIVCLCSCKPEQDRKNIVCLVDFSGSIPENKLKDYAEGIKTILSSMGPEDKLVVYPIDEGSLIDRVALVYEDFQNANVNYGLTFKGLNIPDSISPPFKKVNEDKFTTQNKLPQRLKGYLGVISPRILVRLDSIKTVRLPYASKSDLFSAIYSTKDDLIKETSSSFVNNAFKKKTSNFLIIFSDMVQDSDFITFEMSKGGLLKEPQAIIDSLAANNLLPNLQKARVIVCDNFSYSKIQSGAPSKSLAKNSIRHFWERYFADTTVNASREPIVYQNSGNVDGIAGILLNN